MDVSDQKRAMECRVQDTDWATIGRHIVRAAAMATAVHVTEHEYVHVTEHEKGSGCSPPLKRRSNHRSGGPPIRTDASGVGVQGQANGEART